MNLSNAGRTTNRVVNVIAILSLVASTACSSGSDDPTAGPATTPATDTTTVTADDTAADPPDETADETVPSESAEVPAVFEVLETEPTEAGPRPTLAWAEVDGAAEYDLIVLDSDGQPYWAWSGETTSVSLGGMENPDAVGAWVFEPLTWIVTARDAEGKTLAMSARAELLP